MYCTVRGGINRCDKKRHKKTLRKKSEKEKSLMYSNSSTAWVLVKVTLSESRPALSAAQDKLLSLGRVYCTTVQLRTYVRMLLCIYVPYRSSRIGTFFLFPLPRPFYVAFQSRHCCRRVAIKYMRKGGDSEQFILLFRDLKRYSMFCVLKT